MKSCSDELLKEAAEALDRFDGNQTHAAQELGVSRSTLQRRIQLAAIRGISPYHDRTGQAPDLYVVKGKSTHYGADGQITNQWVKTSIDREREAMAMQATVDALKEQVPRAEPVAPPKASDTDLCALYTITDYHFGQLSWAEETGEDWDTSIAEDLITRWFKLAIQSAPDAHTAVFAQLGDLIHYDGLEAITPTAGNLLDSDTRYQLLVRVAVRALRRIVGMLLEKHQRVIVLMAEGNHDIASSVWLREIFAALYEDEPRVTVDISAKPFYCVEWGQTSLFFHHGHKAKVPELSRIFAGEFREIYGRTKYSYAHCGHLHHVHAKEDALMIVEQHPTLAARDAHTTRMGLQSQRGANVIVYHKESGEVGRVTIRPEMVKEAA